MPLSYSLGKLLDLVDLVKVLLCVKHIISKKAMWREKSSLIVRSMRRLCPLSEISILFVPVRAVTTFWWRNRARWWLINEWLTSFLTFEHITLEVYVDGLEFSEFHILFSADVCMILTFTGQFLYYLFNDIFIWMVCLYRACWRG